MKKLLAIILTLCFALSLTSCSDNSKTAETPSDTVSDTSSEASSEEESSEEKEADEEESDQESSEEESSSKKSSSKKSSSKKSSKKKSSKEESSKKESSSKKSSSKKSSNDKTSTSAISSSTSSETTSSEIDPSLLKPQGSQVITSSQQSSSSDTEDKPTLRIEYSSVADGYIEHNGKWVSKIIRFPGFQCMDDEYILLPEGTTIICDSLFAAFCYQLSGEEFLLDENDCKSLGMEVNDMSSVNLTSGTFVATKDVLVRFSVKGSLDDIQLYFPKNSNKEYKLYSSAEYIAEKNN